jgi:hypothetical protein
MGDNDADTFANITSSDYDFDDDAFAAISSDAKDFISSLLVKRPEYEHIQSYFRNPKFYQLIHFYIKCF